MENVLDAVRITCKALDEHLANNIKVIDIAHLTTISEYFVIADAKNEKSDESFTGCGRGKPG